MLNRNDFKESGRENSKDNTLASNLWDEPGLLENLRSEKQWWSVSKSNQITVGIDLERNGTGTKIVRDVRSERKEITQELEVNRGRIKAEGYNLS